MPPAWLTVVSWLSLAAAFATSALILIDVYGRGHRQRIWIMEPVWVVTALYLGLGVSHCGAGCTLGFLTSVPANVWLIRRGIKEAM